VAPTKPAFVRASSTFPLKVNCAQANTGKNIANSAKNNPFFIFLILKFSHCLKGVQANSLNFLPLPTPALSGSGVLIVQHNMN
jgi:hypothetical protein